ncbi:hypothetical protein Ahia01_000719500 [Argonauta hians]
MEGFEPIPTSLKQQHLMQIPISQIPIPELPSLESLVTHECSHPIPLSTQSLNPRIQTPKVLTMQGVQLPQIPKAPPLPESFSSITKPSSEVTPQGLTPSHQKALETSSLQGPPQTTPEVPLTSKPPLDQGLAQITAEHLQKQWQAFNTQELSTNERQEPITTERLPNQGQAQITPELSTNEGHVQITPNQEPEQFTTESVTEHGSEFLSEQLPEQITVEINPTQANPQMTPQVHRLRELPLMATVEKTCHSNFQMEQEAILSEFNSVMEPKFVPQKISKSSSTSSLSPSSLSQGLPILTKQNSLESYTKTASGFPHPPKLRLCASELANVRQGLKKVIFGNNPRKFLPQSKQENISFKLSNKRRFSDGSVNIEFKQSFLKELDKRLKEIRLAVKWRLLAPWYFHTIDRSAEERLLHNIGQDGTFLVRDSRGHKADHPYTLTVLYHNHIFSVKIRQLVCGHFVLGEEKQDEVKFETVDKLISNYRKKTLLLLGKGGGRVTLSQYPSGF